MKAEHTKLCTFYGINRRYEIVALEDLVDVQAKQIEKLQDDVRDLKRRLFLLDPDEARPPQVREG